MTGNAINLQQMLARREARADEQKKFLEKYHDTLISFSMNIPGPIKTNHKIRAAFDEGRNLIFEALKNIGATVNEFIETHEDIGDEILISVKNIKSPEELKNLAMKIENENKFGRLFDIDVINSDGEKLSRGKFRKCLICDKQAQDCARSRAHTVKEMQDAVLQGETGPEDGTDHQRGVRGGDRRHRQRRGHVFLRVRQRFRNLVGENAAHPFQIGTETLTVFLDAGIADFRDEGVEDGVLLSQVDDLHGFGL